MQYINKSIKFLTRNPVYLAIYLAFSMGIFLVQMFRYLGLVDKLPSFIIEIVILIVSFYLLTGTYSCIWKRFSGEQTQLRNILGEAKRYFSRVFTVSIVIGIIVAVFMGLSMFFHSKIFYPGISMVLYSKQLDANIVRSASVYLIIALFAYAFPSIFISDWRGTMTALKTSLKLIIKKSSISLPVICLITLMFVADIITSQYVVNFEYSSKEYWLATATESVIIYIISLLTFLTAAQIFLINVKQEVESKE